MRALLLLRRFGTLIVMFAGGAGGDNRRHNYDGYKA